MSRRLSIQYKTSKPTQKPRVKFPDELVFLESVKDNDIENVRTMLRRASLSIDINKVNVSGLTALHQAVLDNSLEVVKLLIENHANVNSVDEDSWTPLHAACSMGFLEIVAYLLEKGADANAETSEGERPIDLVEDGQENFALASLLLNHMKKYKSFDDDDNNNNDDASGGNSSSSKATTSTSSSKNSIAKKSTTSVPAAKTSVSEQFHAILMNIFKMRCDTAKKIQEIENSLAQDTNFGKSKQFIRCLTMAICEYCMTSSVSADFDIDAKEFKEKAPILTKFLDNNDENKLECLHAIYDLTLKINNPPNLLKKIYTCLNESRVIGKEMFEMWKSNAEYKFGNKIKLSFSFKDFK